MIPEIKDKLLKLDQFELFDLMKQIPRFRSLEWRSEDIMDRIDWYLPTEDLHIEGKCRRETYEDYIIEKDKFEELMKYDNCWYISSGGNGIFAWDLKELINVTKYKMCWGWYLMNDKTEFGEPKKVWKETEKLHIAYAIYLHPQLLMFPYDRNTWD
jgi:hypothetical protein